FRMSLTHRAAQTEPEHQAQHQQSNRHVPGMKADQRVVRGAKEVGPDGEVVAVAEIGPLARRGAEEERAERNGDEPPETERTHVPGAELAYRRNDRECAR